MSLDSASFSRLVGFLVVVVALLFAGPPAAQAAPILDQSFLPDGVNDFSQAAGCDLPGEVTLCGQSFTVGVTGTLTSIAIRLGEPSGTACAPGTLPVAGLYDVSGGGVTLLQLSPSLAECNILPDDFSTFSFDVEVEAGDQLAILFEIDAARHHLLLETETGAGYIGGGLVRITAPPVPLSGSDAYFATFVDPASTSPVPEGDSAILLGVGVLMLLAARARRVLEVRAN